MLTKIFSVALAAAALAAGGAAQGALERAANANDVVVAIARPQGSGIKAEIRFVRELSGSGLHVDVKASGLPAGQQFPYHIHVSPVPSNGNCTATGGHFDPTGVNTPAAASYKCQPDNAAATCEVGDLAGMYGKMVPDGKGNFIASYNAAMLSFGGKNSILDHSVVIHAPNLTRLACDNIVGYVVSRPDSSTQSSGDGYSSKDVAEGNRRSSSSSGASVRAASLSAALLLVAGAVFA